MNKDNEILLQNAINDTTISQEDVIKAQIELKKHVKNKDFYIQRTYHIVMHKDKKLSSIYQEIFELIKNYPK